MVPEGPRDSSWRDAKYVGSGMSSAVPRRERMVVQSKWQDCWKRDIRAVWVERGGGKGWRVWLLGGAMLKASLGSLGPFGSRDSPCMETQPRLRPPALLEWIA